MAGTPPSSVAAGAVVQLFNSVLTGAAASFDVSGLSQSYNHLKIVCLGRSDNAVANTVYFLRFNGDSGANYDQVTFTGINATGTTASQVAITGIQLGSMPGANATASRAGVIEYLIPAYAGTTFFKTVIAANGWNETTAVGTQSMKSGHGLWRSAAAITQVTILPGVGNFIAGSQCSIYGVL